MQNEIAPQRQPENNQHLDYNGKRPANPSEEVSPTLEVSGNNRRPIKLKTYEARKDKSVEEFSQEKREEKSKIPSLIFNTNVPELRMGARKISRKSLVLRASHENPGQSDFEGTNLNPRDSPVIDINPKYDFVKRPQGNQVSYDVPPEKRVFRDFDEASRKNQLNNSSNFLEVKSPPQRLKLETNNREKGFELEADKRSFHPWVVFRYLANFLGQRSDGLINKY